MHDGEMAVPDARQAHWFTGLGVHYDKLVRLMVRLSEQYIRSQRKREDKALEAETSSGCMAEWTGDDTYFLRGRVSRSSGASSSSSSELSQHQHHRHCKRVRRCYSSTPSGRAAGNMNWAPDEILVAIFSCIVSARDRSSCASVCKRWLMLQTHMHRDELKCCDDDEVVAEESEGVVNQPCREQRQQVQAEEDLKLEKQPLWALGDLSRCLEGKNATDVRLAAIAVGTGARGGLGKLAIRSGPGERAAKGVTDVGLTAIGISCNALKSLTLWDCPNITDASLRSIGRGCRLLESLDLVRCPNIGDVGVQEIASGCLRLLSLGVECCEGVGSAGMKSVADNCSNLLTLTLSRCSGIDDCAIAALTQSCKTLRKLKLEELGISDAGVLFLANQSRALNKLVLSGMERVTQRGFGYLLSSTGLKALRIVALSSCAGVTDEFLSGLGKAFKELKAVRLIDCGNVSDTGLLALVEACRCLKGLHIDKCSRITFQGLGAAMSALSGTLKTAHLSRFWSSSSSPSPPAGASFRLSRLTSLSITHSAGLEELLRLWQCETGLGSSSSCCGCLPVLEHLDLTGMRELSDSGLCSFLEHGGSRLVSLCLRDCVRLTEAAVAAVAERCGRTLQAVVLEGVTGGVTDASVTALASVAAAPLAEVDVAGCEALGDAGVAALLAGVGPLLRSLSLSRCGRVSDASLRGVARVCDSLCALNLRGCAGVSAAAVAALTAQLGARCTLLPP